MVEVHNTHMKTPNLFAVVDSIEKYCVVHIVQCFAAHPGYRVSNLQGARVDW